MAEVYQCSSCPPEEACGLDGESFDRSYDECHHPLTLEKARLYAAAADLYAACQAAYAFDWKSGDGAAAVYEQIAAAIRKAEGA